MKYLILLLIPILTACAGSGGSGDPASAPAPHVALPGTTPTPVPVTPTPPGVIPTVDVTYYSVVHAVNGVLFTGACANYGSDTYCWDDGVKPVNANHYSFWQVTNPLGSCSGNCASDLLSVPTTLSANVLAEMNHALMNETPTHVLATGAATTVTCEIQNNVLNCIDFEIDLNQVSL